MRNRLTYAHSGDSFRLVNLNVNTLLLTNVLLLRSAAVGC